MTTASHTTVDDYLRSSRAALREARAADAWQWGLIAAMVFVMAFGVTVCWPRPTPGEPAEAVRGSLGT